MTTTLENPAYGRHRISRPMRIADSSDTKEKPYFFFLFGGGGGRLDMHTDVQTDKEMIKNTKIMLERWNFE